MMQEILDLWQRESAYVVHDIICRMATNFAEFWDDDHPLLKDYQWYLDTSERYATLPSDKVRKDTERQMKHPPPEWDTAMVAQQSRRSEWEPTTSR